jgi:sulfate adenylyltransferase subunit 1
MGNLKRDNIDLLRFSVIGSVDDGKSTLIGRLMYDSKSIFEDQLQAIEESSKKRGDGTVNLALLTDGLRAEREQGITIDVAYRYFATPKRKFIIADCPGHVQYTRNMVTGTSNVNLATVLVDARNGVVEQTKRHTFIANLMQVKHLVLCVNKMDLVDYSEERFEEIKADYLEFISKLDIPDVHVIPISALDGDNIVDKSEKMSWYEGATYLYTLENVHLGADHNYVDCRFPIQRVIRPQSKEYHDFRGYAGRVEGGVFKPGDDVVLMPSGFSTKIESIGTLDEPELKEAFHPMSVVMTLKDEFDLSRGDMIVKDRNRPEVTQDVDLMVCWFNEKALIPRGKYTIKHTTKDMRCMVKEVTYKVDIHTLHRKEDDKTIGMNDIGRITIRTSKPIFTDSFKRNRETGAVILVDEFTNETVAAGMVIS